MFQFIAKLDIRHYPVCGVLSLPISFVFFRIQILAKLFGLKFLFSPTESALYFIFKGISVHI